MPCMWVEACSKSACSRRNCCRPLDRWLQAVPETQSLCIYQTAAGSTDGTFRSSAYHCLHICLHLLPSGQVHWLGKKRDDIGVEGLRVSSDMTDPYCSSIHLPVLYRQEVIIPLRAAENLTGNVRGCSSDTLARTPFRIAQRCRN
jgi:hypothetical protein